MYWLSSKLRNPNWDACPKTSSTRRMIERAIAISVPDIDKAAGLSA
jgi:hypothetical protein